MKKWSKYLTALMGAAFLTFGGSITASAAEEPAPFTADQLMGAVNAQCANVSSLQEVLAENVQMVDAESGIAVSMDMVMDFKQSKLASHAVVGAAMSAMGYTENIGFEVYTVISGTTLYTYTLDSDTAVWEAESRTLSETELAVTANPFSITGIDTATATVTVDGNRIRLRGVMDASSMEELNEILSMGDISSSRAFPIVLDIDATTLLPVSMMVEMQDLTIAELPDMAVSAHATVTFTGYNQYDNLAVPAEVVANAA